MSAQSLALAQAVTRAPAPWIASYGRINNRVREQVRNAATDALAALEAIPTDERGVTYWGAEQALLDLRRSGEGTDPRGGPERDQMRVAAEQVAQALARTVISEEATS